MGNKEMKRKIFVIIIQTLGGNKEICYGWEVLSIQPFRSRGFLKFLSLKRESKMSMDLGIRGNVEYKWENLEMWYLSPCWP